MKKQILTTITALSLLTISLSSQNLDDALRYSRTFNYGTARFMAMGGAFTSLGADLSAISLNPAGTGMFRSFEMAFTPGLLYNNTSTVFNATNSTDFKYHFGINQAGVVSNLISNQGSEGLTALNFAYSWNRTNNFNENINITGISDISSMADYWALSSEGTYYKNLRGSAGIAYDVWVIDTITGSGGASYGTVFSNYGDNDPVYGQTIRRVISNEGYSGEHAFSIGANISDKYFFGATLGINRLKYTGHYEHLEADYDNVIPDFRNFVYTDHFEASGTGYNLKMGFIVRPMEILRIGAAFHTPTVYRIREYFYDQISSEFDDNLTYNNNNEPKRYSYTLTTPFRAMVGASVQIGKLAIVSADYEISDYATARFSKASDDYNYYNENQSIRNALKTASVLRLGGEFRLNTFYFRGGYGLYGSAFKGGEINEDLSYNAISFGLGFRQQNMYFDLGFANISNSLQYLMYDDEPYLKPATVTFTRNSFTATLGFKF
ncbi:MAG TPA: hypothetical protein P5257_09090 [Bacteroidales bacterium]|nr:hypothetical protein [Bacteroidales bacterium]